MLFMLLLYLPQDPLVSVILLIKKFRPVRLAPTNRRFHFGVIVGSEVVDFGPCQCGVHGSEP